MFATCPSDGVQELGFSYTKTCGHVGRVEAVDRISARFGVDVDRRLIPRQRARHKAKASERLSFIQDVGREKQLPVAACIRSMVGRYRAQ